MSNMAISMRSESEKAPNACLDAQYADMAGDAMRPERS